MDDKYTISSYPLSSSQSVGKISPFTLKLKQSAKAYYQSYKNPHDTTKIPIQPA